METERGCQKPSVQQKTTDDDDYYYYWVKREWTMKFRVLVIEIGLKQLERGSLGSCEIPTGKKKRHFGLQ